MVTTTSSHNPLETFASTSSQVWMTGVPIHEKDDDNVRTGNRS